MTALTGIDPNRLYSPEEAAPLILRAAGVGRLLGRSATWFYQHRAELERAGLPAKDRLLGGWHRHAVEAWVASRAGTVQSLGLDAEREAMRRAVHAPQRGEGHAIRHP